MSASFEEMVTRAGAWVAIQIVEGKYFGQMGEIVFAGFTGEIVSQMRQRRYRTSMVKGSCRIW
ncbi:MAG: hypothetical protein ABIS43_21440 [Opitutus sp.]